ncbi:glycogen operon protein [Kytococcus aerolatus]|uniref:Glycogen operon protein n=1 Tax=Kytococcus aerolatus TaxID=592308 RepID=A0A212U0W4_9MICO|nr:glycogen debranching protein GlgX [Kytococcus aerolatus]SNC71776.1 glycogen operon protein [Kytococcus aerolatus]
MAPLPGPSPDIAPAPGLRRLSGPAAGAAVDPVEVCVVAPDATAVWLCLQQPDGSERREPLRHRVHGAWFDHVQDVPAGTRYCFRADGPWDPTAGHRFNPAKRLLDPYGTVVTGEPRLGPEIFAHAVDDSLEPVDGGAQRSEVDSGDAVPWNVVPADGPAFDWQGDEPLRTPWRDTVVVEGHVQGLTARHPDLPEELRGTYAGLAHPAVLQHYRNLGATAIELLPVHAKASETELMARGHENYWGYNSLSWFAPHPGYAATDDPLAVVDEFRGMVRALHSAGLEVILDVVYNHTCEQSMAAGPTYSWRGLDARGVYRLDDVARDVDHTGCRNTVDTNDPDTLRMVLDSLRHWVTEYHVDGFRFDLLSAVARDERGAWRRDHPLLVALRTDPVLSGVKLVAEPWDVSPGGWQTGSYPPPFAEWNDRFRDATRDFWLTGAATISELATRFSGSSDLFDHHGRLPTSSVNFVTAHDGFTLHDLTAYDHKHNEANGEENRDGSDQNRSANHGVEGPVPDTEQGRVVAAARRRSMRNLLATTILATGTPMLTAGDEFGRTQGGNNNLYALTPENREDAALDWGWETWQTDLLETTRRLLELRRRFAAIGHQRFYAPWSPTPEGDAEQLAEQLSEPLDEQFGRPGGVAQVQAAWFAQDGQPMTGEQWADPARRSVTVALVPPADEVEDGDEAAVVIALHAGGAGEVVLPQLGDLTRATLEWSAAWEHPDHPDSDADPQPGQALPVSGPSVIVWSLRRG